MRKQILLVLGICAAAVYGCEDSSSSASHEEDACKTMTCKGGEHCDAGKCLCGDKECAADESCVENKCEKTSVPPDEDLCKDKTCGEGEHCDAGKCLCGDKECGQDESCVEGKCEKSTVPPDDDPCKEKTCGEGEHCDAGKCLCGDKECGDDETCEDGACNSVPQDSDGPITECTPPYGNDENCVTGACQPVVLDPECKPACNSESQYCDKGVCKDYQSEQCSACKDGETCNSGICMCGKTTCNEDEYCKADVCEPVDPCAGKECKAGEECVDGTCKAVTITLKPSTLDVMLSSVSNKLVATSLDGSKLDWTVGGKAAHEEMPKDDKNDLLLKCRKSDKTLSTKLSECIIKKDNTETVQFVGYSRHLKTVTIAVKNSKGDTAEATLTLKPYFDTGGFIKTNDMFYRNGYCPGQQMTALDPSSNNYYDPKLDNSVCNLGGIETKYGPANIYGEQTFSEEELAVIDKDMYLKYVHPKLLKGDDGSFYGTRASVVAAARFLILQFPYDIPYTSNGVNRDEKLLSHYLFASKESGEVSEVDIHGLNLTSNVYNSSTKHDASNIIKNDAVPWGGAYSKPNESKYGDNKTLEFPYNGLECTGFATWALRNGFLGLGDWNTNLFAKDGRCRKGGKAYKDGKAEGEIERNYKCEDIVNNKDCNYLDTANKNNKLLLAYPKLSRLEDDDFIEISKKNENDLQDIFKDVKAGDLLVRNNKPTLDDLKKYPDMIYKYGHVAMIIGIKRDSKGLVTSIYVGEAVSRSGNRLSKYETMGTFANSGAWVNSDAYTSFIVKMEKVYNFYSDKYIIKAESKTSDCPNNVKSGGDCYYYTDTYNDAFNDALKMQ